MRSSCLLFITAFVHESSGCGYIPSSCLGDLSWAVDKGISSNPGWYPNFQTVTGTALTSASQNDMVTYWVCLKKNPNGNCNGLQLPCSRSCYPSSGSSTSTSTSSSLRVVTMNLFWWNLFGQRNGANFFNVFSASGPYDLYFFQECDDVNHIKNGLGVDIVTFQPARAVALAWSNSRFQLISRGWEDVAEDRYDQYYGKRCIVWARLRDTVSGKYVFAASHHGPLPIDSGGQTGGAAVASRINAVINYNKQSGDVVIIGGDFNAGDRSATVRQLQANGFNLLATDWVDHIFTKGSGLDTTPSINIIRDTGSDHRGVKVTWSSGISGSNSEIGTGSSTTQTNCGYIPSSCSGDLTWAVNKGKTRYPQYYPNFQSVTGSALSSASQADMVTYWYCTRQNPNNRCTGLQIACGRSCYSAFELSDAEYPDIEEMEGEEDNGEDRSNMQWIFFGVALAVILLVIAVGGGFLYFRKRNKEIVAVNEDDEEVQQIDDKDKQWDMSPINATTDGQTAKNEEEEALDAGL